MSHNTTGIKIKARAKRRSLKAKDPVEVFCRIRPSEEVEPEDTEGETYTRCIEHISETVIQLNPPKSSLAFKAGNKSTTQHTFKFVFQETATQKKVFDQVARPLVYDQLNVRPIRLCLYSQCLYYKLDKFYALETHNVQHYTLSMFVIQCTHRALLIIPKSSSNFC